MTGRTQGHWPPDRSSSTVRLSLVHESVSCSHFAGLLMTNIFYFQTFQLPNNLIKMENSYLLPSELCDRIFAHEFQMDTGNISEDLLTRTVQLYVEAISYYTSLNAQLAVQPGFDPTAVGRRSKFYQQKIKRLLVRSDVQQCLVGKSSNAKGMDLQKELAKVNLQVPEQVRALVKHYSWQLKQKQNLIESSLARQRNELAERIERRSKSKRKSERKSEEVELSMLKLKMGGVVAHF